MYISKQFWIFCELWDITLSKLLWDVFSINYGLYYIFGVFVNYGILFKVNNYGMYYFFRELWDVFSVNYGMYFIFLDNSAVYLKQTIMGCIIFPWTVGCTFLWPMGCISIFLDIFSFCELWDMSSKLWDVLSSAQPLCALAA